MSIENDRTPSKIYLSNHTIRRGVQHIVEDIIDQVIDLVNFGPPII